VHAIDRAHPAHTLATQLSGMSGTWTADGETVQSEGSPRIVVTDLHGGAEAPNHVDIGVA